MVEAKHKERAIADFFPPLEQKPSSLEKEKSSIERWTRQLNQIADELDGLKGFNEKVKGDVQVAIDTWKEHPDHGAQHSYNVYQGMKWLAIQDGREVETSDSQCQASAVLHDLMQILPFVDPCSGQPFKGNQRKLHPKAMAVAVRYFGKRLKLSERDIEELSFSIRHHDAVYEGRNNVPFSYLGQLLTDADKLFGASLSRDPKDLAAEAIWRNRKGASNPEGWYLLRDLTVEERASWRYGDRWLSDRVSAVKMDIFGVPFYTSSGKKIAEQRRQAFMKQAKTKYGEEYDQTITMIDKWRKAHSPGVTVSLVGKNQKAVVVQNLRNIEKILLTAFNKPLLLNSKYLREGFEARGWKVQVELGEETLIIDPSIARFTTKEGFISTLTDAFRIEQGT